MREALTSARHARRPGKLTKSLLVQVKQNQPTLHETLARLLRRAPPLRQPPAASPGASIGRGLRHQLDPEWQPLITCVARVSRLTFEKDTRDVGEDDSRIRQKPGAMARIRSAALNILRANGIQNVCQALYINALNFISTPSTSYQRPQLRQATRARILMTRTEWPWPPRRGFRRSGT